MVAFIDAHRGAYGGESICVVLPIASSTNYETKARAADPTRVPARVRTQTSGRRSTACGATIGGYTARGRSGSSSPAKASSRRAVPSSG
jgi:hypothetical protein